MSTDCTIRPLEAAPDEDAGRLVRLRDHRLRHLLNRELHARPYVGLQPPEQISHLALHTGEEAAAEDHARLVELCERYAVTPPLQGVTHFVHDMGPFRLKWERHTEFVTYTFFRDRPAGEPFLRPAIDVVARDWLDRLPSEVLVAVHVAVVPAAVPALTTGELSAWLEPETTCGSTVTGGAATVHTDFTIHADGFSRILVHDRALEPLQAGRLVQRLLEIQTYWTMALLALPLVRESAPEIGRCERQLSEAMAGLSEEDGIEGERGLLDRLTLLAGSVERLSATTSYRLRASEAYAALVHRRLEEIREERIEGLQTLGEFLDRRFAPAMRTCSATAQRVDEVARRVGRANELLHTRIGIAVQEQHRELLGSVDRRAAMQLHLQEMVEGLSVVAIAYYAIGILAYALEAVPRFHPPFAPGLATAFASPAVVLSVWLLLRRMRQRVTR